MPFSLARPAAAREQVAAGPPMAANGLVDAGIRESFGTGRCYMEFFVDQSVLDIGVKIQFAVVEGFYNTRPSPEWMAYRDARIAELAREYRDLDVKADPVLEGFNVLHDNAHVRRHKNVPAPNNLIKLLKKRGSLGFINTVVDVYNLVSLESRLALGAHDMDRVEGNFTLRLADGSERFVPLGLTEPQPVKPGEYCYCDDSNEVLCRLEVRQVNKTAVNEQTTRAAFIVQGNEATSDEYVLETAERLVAAVTKVCGGAGRVLAPDVI